MRMNSKWWSLFCAVLIAATLLIGPSSKVEAASCIAPTCFNLGGGYVRTLKRGWYRSSGVCIVLIKYLGPTGSVVDTDYDYYWAVNSEAYVYVGPVYSGKSISLVKVTSNWKYINGKSVYNTCTQFRWVGP